MIALQIYEFLRTSRQAQLALVIQAYIRADTTRMTVDLIERVFPFLAALDVGKQCQALSVQLRFLPGEGLPGSLRRARCSQAAQVAIVHHAPESRHPTLLCLQTYAGSMLPFRFRWPCRSAEKQ